ncbi:MAG: methionine--tRNA ligase [Candidatus Paceibacterota bacterium]
MKQTSFYLTTTLPYVNAELHMGHALEFIRADAIARYKKLQGFDVFFNTGTDEHGTKILEKAQEEGIEVQNFVDKNFSKFKDSLESFGMSKDIHFIRTTDENHIKLAQEFWSRVYNNGYIYKKNYEAKYCVGCESEKTHSELNEAGFCPDHDGRELQTISEENYFFKYSSFTEKLLKFYEDNPNFIIPEFRYNEIKMFVERGLNDFSISRLASKMPWGIPVPNDPEHVMYVWFDALTNYINTLDWQNNKEQFEKYWVSGTPTQYCGKDNTRFQGAMWQAMLMAADFQNSNQIVVNGFITGDGGVKMSKTLGNVVNPREIVEEYGTDALRYFMLREISSFEDSPFTRERFLDAYNAGLANGLGNLTSRILTLSEKYLKDFSLSRGFLIPPQISLSLEQYKINEAMNAIWNLIDILDKYIQETQAFRVIKTDEDKGKALIIEYVTRLYDIGKSLEAFLPETSIKIIQLIKENKKPEQPLFLRKD